MRPEDQRAVVARLRTTQGHLAGIARMVESGQPCGAILHQVAAAQAALRAIRRQLIQMEALNCVEVLKNSDCPEKRDQMAQRLLAMYEREPW